MEFFNRFFKSQPDKKERPPADGSVTDNYSLSESESAELDHSAQIAALSRNIEAAKNNPEHPHANDVPHMQEVLDNLIESQKRLGK